MTKSPSNARSEPAQFAPPDTVEGAIRIMVPKLPKPIRLRAENALDHLDRAITLLPIDREMASFRAITGEEEAVAALFKALQHQKYPKAERLSVKDHTHKAAAIACMMAIRNGFAKWMHSVKLQIDFDNSRIDIKIPLSALGIKQPPGLDLHAQPDEPLNIFRSNGKGEQVNVFEDDLASLAKGSKFEEIRHLVKSQANARNTLLYASNKSKPRSRVTNEGIEARKRNAILALSVCVVALQSDKHQGMLCQAIDAFLDITKRLPEDLAT